MTKNQILKSKNIETKNPIILKYWKKTPNWLRSAILYGLSWSMIFDLNLNFLAWFALVPLFLSLENKNTFRSFYLQGFWFSIISYFIICHGFIFTAKEQILTLIGSADELFMSSISFAILYPFKKKFGFAKALFIFPFIFLLYEWIYQWFEHTYGYLMLSHSQCQNIWLIQFIDIFGVLSIGFWVLIFNILIYFAYKKYQENHIFSTLGKQILIISLIMIIPPSSYSVLKYYELKNEKNEKVNITLINSHFSILKTNYNDVVDNVSRLTYITDSIDCEFKKRNFKTDLYVWHEGAVAYGNDKYFTDFIDTAVNNWQTSLLTGMMIKPIDTTKEDKRKVNRAILFSVGDTLSLQQSYYDKVRLAAGHEFIPYHKFLSKIPFFGIDLYDTTYLKNSETVKLIEFKTQNQRIIKFGTPICMEQNYSSVWNEMSLAGAQFYVQLSYESWWKIPYFLKQMSEITKLRAIETRKYVARCSNGGKTQFYDSFGRIYSTAINYEGTTSADIYLSDKISFYTQNPNFFVYFCFVTLLILTAYMFFNKSK